MSAAELLVALLAAIPPTLVALAAFIQALRTSRKVDAVHVDVNSRLTQLLKATAEGARAEGVAEGLATVVEPPEAPRKRP